VLHEFAVVQVYTAEKVHSLLHALKQEVTNVLLFLKNVQRIEVHHWPLGSSESSLMYSCSLTDTSSVVLAARRYVISLAAEAQPHKELAPRAHTLSIALQDGSGKTEMCQRFLISQACGGGASDELAKAASRQVMRHIPYHGYCYPHATMCILMP